MHCTISQVIFGYSRVMTVGHLHFIIDLEALRYDGVIVLLVSIVPCKATTTDPINTKKGKLTSSNREEGVILKAKSRVLLSPASTDAPHHEF